MPMYFRCCSVGDGADVVYIPRRRSITPEAEVSTLNIRGNRECLKFGHHFPSHGNTGCLVAVVEVAAEEYSRPLMEALASKVALLVPWITLVIFCLQ